MMLEAGGLGGRRRALPRRRAIGGGKVRGSPFRPEGGESQLVRRPRRRRVRARIRVPRAPATADRSIAAGRVVCVSFSLARVRVCVRAWRACASERAIDRVHECMRGARAYIQPLERSREITAGSPAAGRAGPPRHGGPAARRRWGYLVVDLVR